VLLPDQVKPFLGHEEKIVRDHAAKYLAKSFNRDPGLMPLVLESCARHGEEESGRLLAYAADFIQSEISLHTVLERLAQSDNPKAIHHYNNIIGRADIDLSREEDLSIKTFLAMGICDLISGKGIPVVKRLIDNNDYDRGNRRFAQAPLCRLPDASTRAGGDG
jgi:HEAT repeat protein